MLSILAHKAHGLDKQVQSLARENQPAKIVNRYRQEQEGVLKLITFLKSLKDEVVPPERKETKNLSI